MGRVIQFRPAPPPPEMPSKSMDILVRIDGPRAAAWLVRTHKQKFRKMGACYFDIQAEEQTPVWFRVAIEFLKRRKGWTVRKAQHAGIRRYTIAWMNFGRFDRKALYGDST